MSIINKLYLYRLERNGFRHGTNFHLEKGANIDAKFADLIECGDNVTFARHVYILAHDASMKKFLGKARISAVSIGSNVFIGTYTTVLPGVTIGNNCIVAAHSCVTKDIPDGEVWGGVPACFLMKTEEFLNKHEMLMIDCSHKELTNDVKKALLNDKKRVYID